MTVSNFFKYEQVFHSQHKNAHSHHLLNTHYILKLPL
jgi:hypothetical protein